MRRKVTTARTTTALQATLHIGVRRREPLTGWQCRAVQAPTHGPRPARTQRLTSGPVGEEAQLKRLLRLLRGRLLLVTVMLLPVMLLPVGTRVAMLAVLLVGLLGARLLRGVHRQVAAHGLRGLCRVVPAAPCVPAARPVRPGAPQVPRHHAGVLGSSFGLPGLRRS